MADTAPRLLISALKPFYDAVLPWTWVLVRVGVGWNLIVHGWGKILRGPEQQGAMLAKDNAALGFKMAIFLTIFEFVGGIAITLGLFTRVFAAAVAIEMGYLVWPHYW